jgi:hypothetical protein
MRRRFDLFKQARGCEEALKLFDSSLYREHEFDEIAYFLVLVY